nr:adenosylcobinamide-phosphate synthase CbiB [Leptolyngbya sp. FACHB-36]
MAIAAGLDYLIGDPKGWWHPVQGMGWTISRYTRWVFDWLKHPLALRVAGVVLGVGLILGSGILSWGLIAGAEQLHPIARAAIESVALTSCFAGRSLRAAAEDVLRSLSTGDLVRTRSILSQYVGRDTESLSEAEILRAVLETVTENATDGVLAPLFYALLGAALPGVGSVPLAMAYKAASTLDSMVGYREAPYTDLGWFSAKLEDRLTWLPCRLVVLTIALLSNRPFYVWRLCRRDGPKDASPNSGWSECAYAAALDVQLGGINTYRGIVKHKPLLGDAAQPITVEHVQKALQLTRSCFLIWLAIGVGLLSLAEALR